MSVFSKFVNSEGVHAQLFTIGLKEKTHSHMKYGQYIFFVLDSLFTNMRGKLRMTYKPFMVEDQG